MAFGIASKVSEISPARSAEIHIRTHRVLERTIPSVVRWLGLAIGALASVMAAPSLAQDQTSFFKGKTITLYVGFAGGGSYDYYSRLIARYLPKHVPGNPNVVVQNMTGAGSL